MGWERGYYYRVRKVNGRVVRDYIGCGELADLTAQLDALEREQRRVKANELRGQKDELKALDTDLTTMSESIDLVARAALLAAGYHQHKRGEWRKRRERTSKSGTRRSKEA